MDIFENRVMLSESILLEYNKLPPIERCDDMLDEDKTSFYIESARVNNEEAKLFSTCNIALLVEYIFNSHPGFSQFVELRDIVYPDVDIMMYYDGCFSYSEIDDWMKAVIQQLILQGDIIPFSRSKLVVQKVEDYSKHYDEDTIFLIKHAFAPFDQGIIDQIVFQKLYDAECYTISFDRCDVEYETDALDGLTLNEAIRTARRIPELIYNTLTFFSMASVQEAFRIYIRNNISSRVLEMDISPATDTSYSHHYDVHSKISSEALQTERNFILAQKKAYVWEYRDIADNNKEEID